MGQRKGHPLGVAREGMIILRLQGRPLSSHTGMPHHDGRIPGDPKVQGMGGSRVLVDVECASRVIGDPGSIGSSFLTEFR